ncbi:hypothetical protein S40285_08964 [Stachybotrys chlorohalonatus IBT 40285]|uniref:Uncharacterized protein n=1 Tax=Stachybotrys chlorohalonatus (strain IBT 40285) TaxID=1283841 RepID=A0A084Q7W3_STAC4|nr:hypothetical protein S40285_08964 [Stachybotrys chlorohalonata IBT 40285]
MAAALLTGVAFGAALVASGVFQPAVITAQLKLDDFRMLQSFLTAAAASGIVVSAFQLSGHTKLPPRRYSSLGLFSFFDGNLIGGLLLGAGMAFAGSCPGTVLAQVGAGSPSSYATLGGGIIGGLAWTGFLEQWTRSSASQSGSRDAKRPLTVGELLGLHPSMAALLLQALMSLAVLSLLTFTNQASVQSLVPPVTGGLLISVTQLVSLALRRSTLGTSKAFEDVAQYILQAVGLSKGPLPQSQNLIMATGVALGGFLLSVAYPSVASGPKPAISSAASAFGGFLMVVGARLAGGCTSGHGISGTSLSSLSSLLTTGAMLAGGMATAAFLSY